MGYREKIKMKNSILILVEKIKDELMSELMDNVKDLIESKVRIRKQFYSLKEVSYLTGLTINAIKGRYRRGTLKVVYEGTTPLIPTPEVERLIKKLKLQN